MLRRILARFRAVRSGGDGPERADGPEESSDDDAEDGGFLRSRLDASVLYAHGRGNVQAEREIAALQEEQRLREERERQQE